MWQASRGRQLLMVTVTPSEVVVWPAASRAVAVSVYVPFAAACESHPSVYFAGDPAVDTSGPIDWPFNWNCTPTSA